MFRIREIQVFLRYLEDHKKESRTPFDLKQEVLEQFKQKNTWTSQIAQILEAWSAINSDMEISIDRAKDFALETLLEEKREHKTLLVMAATISLGVTREGFEILVYLYGFSADLPRFITILSGSVIGACIGISIGALIYYLVSALSYRLSLIAGLGLLALVAAGMLSQAVLLLIQADWLPSQFPLWDSSGWLPESSVTGQLLYALIGYEATPTALQASFYFGGLSLLLIVAVFAVRSREQAS